MRSMAGVQLERSDIRPVFLQHELDWSWLLRAFDEWNTVQRARMLCLGQSTKRKTCNSASLKIHAHVDWI